MKIAGADASRYWMEIAGHTGTSDDGAPWPLQVHVAALIGNTGAEASFATFNGQSPSTWMVYIITINGRLIWVRMEFDAEEYDLERDMTVAADSPVPTTVAESWIRSLSDVVRLDVGLTRMRPTQFQRALSNEIDLGDISLVFRDGATVHLQTLDQTGMTMYDDRSRSDSFIDALRKHSGL